MARPVLVDSASIVSTCSRCCFYKTKNSTGFLELFGRTTSFTGNLLQRLRDVCIWSYSLELAMSLVLLLADCFKENDAAVDVDLG